jgi:hypothetical protein
MKRLMLSVPAVLASLAAVAAQALCIYPTAPDNIPVDGASATRDEMVAAMQSVKQFDADIAAYTACLDMEFKAALADPTLADEEKVRRREMFVERNDAAVGHAEQVATRFNEQLRAFNAASKK